MPRCSTDAWIPNFAKVVKLLFAQILFFQFLKLACSRRISVVYWLRQRTHEWEVVDSKPYWADHLSGTIHLDQKAGAKRDNGMFQTTLHCCMCCNPANGRVDFEDSWLIKSSFIFKDEHEASQLTKTKVQQKNLRAIVIS